MVWSIEGRNVNDMWPRLYDMVMAYGSYETSRNGDVHAMSEPVAWVINKPTERVLFDWKRDANPFFHLFEGVWMLGGDNRVTPLAYFVANMRNFSDDGITLGAAYGHRVQKHFGHNQWDVCFQELLRNPDSRRCVVNLYDPRADHLSIHDGGKDIACNTQIMLRIRNDSRRQERVLDFLITNRSNDLVWGAMGANIVHFSMMQEWAANRLGVSVGMMTTISNNLHIYDKIIESITLCEPKQSPRVPSEYRRYARGLVKSYPLLAPNLSDDADTARLWYNDLAVATTSGWRGLTASGDYNTTWFRTIFHPMMVAHQLHRNKATEHALVMLEQMPIDSDWRRAAKEWLTRRQSAVVMS